MTSKTLSVTLGAALLALAGAAQADTARLINPANGHAYQQFTGPLVWDEASTACTGYGGYLATLTSQAEQDWLWTNIMSGGAAGIGRGHETWLGGSALDADSDPQVWGAWVTGEDWAYTHWQPSEPSVFQSGLTIGFYPNGYWDNDFKYLPFRYICEWVPDYIDTAVIFRASRRPVGTPISAVTVTDYALLARYGDTHYLQLVNGYSGQPLVSTSLGSAATVTPQALTVTDHMGRALVTVLINQADGSSIAQVYDATTAALLRTITLPN